MLDSELHQKFLKVLTTVPATATVEGRTALLAGLPPNVTASLSRDPAAHTDLGNIIGQLDRLGCTDTGQKPLIIVAQNALAQVAGMEAGLALVKIIADLQLHYDSKDVTCKPAMYELIKPHNFDLKKLVSLCEEKIPLDPKLTGIVFLCPSSRLLTYLCVQLKEQLRKFFQEGIWDRHFKIGGLCGASVSNVIKEIEKFRKKLSVLNILISVQVEEYEDVRVLWTELSERFKGTLDNHLVVIVEISSVAGFPKNKKLYSPEFKSADVRNWISEVINGHGWQKELITAWAKLVNFECNHSNKLDIELVYDHLCEFEMRFRESVTHEDFQKIIRDRLNAYVQTCD